MTRPDVAGVRACAWCGRDECPRWIATARLVGMSARRIMGRPRPTDDVDKAVEQAFEAGNDPVCQGPKED